MQSNKGYKIIEPFLIILAMAMVLSFCVDMTGETLRKPSYFFALLAATIVCIICRKSLPKDWCIWVMLGGSLTKIAYILYTAVWTRQHDVISFGAGEGHAAYIEYILNMKSLPDFDPRLVWAFFQPPLHHLISAVWMWINIRLHIAERQIHENMQVLTLCYMLILMLVVYYICKELAMSNRGILITMLIVSFHPIYILLSGSINNDALSIMLTAVAMYIAILWYKNSSFLYAILLALSIGFAMMAKLSAGLVAPGIGAMIIYKVIKDRDRLVKYIAEGAIFSVIVFPLGLWWQIRNKLLWDMPLNYIPEVGEQLTHSDMGSRLFDFRMHSVYPAMINNNDAYDEYNVFLALIKTSLFGESNFSLESRIITPFATLLFIFAVILIVLKLVAFIRVIFVKEASPEVGYKILLGVTAVSLLGGYLAFALSYNNFSAQDFRYSALMISVMAIILGLWDDRLSAVRSSKNTNEVKAKRIAILQKIIMIAAILFAVFSASVYILVGLV